LRVYLPFVEPLKHLDPDARALDLGCGRGEWLELTKELGLNAHGIDLDDGMLLACKELDLSVETGDAISYLEKLADESQTVVSAFHVVEHIAFEQLQLLVSEAIRVLKPGGLLIMETPNPENIVVATRNFYLDPTHQRPIPPELLSFLPEFYGFSRIKIIRLQESKDLIDRADLTLQDVLSGASPDYAVVAQKGAVEDVMSQLDTAFKNEYGLSLENLTGRYQSQISARIEQAEMKGQLAKQVMADIDNNRSWRITPLLQWCDQQREHIREQGFWTRSKSLIKKIVGPSIRLSIRFIAARPALRAKIVRAVKLLGLYHVMSTVYRRLSGLSYDLSSLPEHSLNHSNKLYQLTPRAQKIYADLKAAMEKDKETF
jgi:O-antigen chain-terminating methyltransferase